MLPQFSYVNGAGSSNNLTQKVSDRREEGIPHIGENIHYTKMGTVG